MNFQNYYLNQARGSLSYFQGSTYQRDYGLGRIFRRIFKWIMPIIKEHGYPIIKNVGKEVIKGVSNLANDGLDGKDIKESTKSRLEETLNSIKNTTGRGINRKNRRKSVDTKKIKVNRFVSKIKPGKKLRIKASIHKKKRKLDIFDSK